MKRVMLAMIACGFVTLLGACSSTSSSTDTMMSPSSNTVGSGTAGDFPTGSYTAVGLGGNTWGQTFETDASVELTFEGAVVAAGVFSVSGDQITFEDTSGPGACRPGVLGTYRWSLDGAQLTFELVGDGCGGRRGVLTATPWTRE